MGSPWLVRVWRGSSLLLPPLCTWSPLGCHEGYLVDCEKQGEAICLLSNHQCRRNPRRSLPPHPGPCSLLPLFVVKTYFLLAVLGLRCCAQAFCSCSDRGRSSAAMLGLLVAVFGGLSLRGTSSRRQGLSSCGAQALLLCGMWALLGSGLNPRPQHWQVDSLPLDHQGSRRPRYLIASLHPSWIQGPM